MFIFDLLYIFWVCFLIEAITGFLLHPHMYFYIIVCLVFCVCEINNQTSKGTTDFEIIGFFQKKLFCHG